MCSYTYVYDVCVTKEIILLAYCGIVVLIWYPVSHCASYHNLNEMHCGPCPLRAPKPEGLVACSGCYRQQVAPGDQKHERGRKRREIWRDVRSIRNFWILVSYFPYHGGPFCDY